MFFPSCSRNYIVLYPGMAWPTGTFLDGPQGFVAGGPQRIYSYKFVQFVAGWPLTPTFAPPPPNFVPP